MKVKDLIKAIETLAPSSYQEKYDNSGLQCGDYLADAKGALITLDCTEEIVEEAIKKSCNVIIAHHPIIFGGINNISHENHIGRTLIKAIKNDINIYAAHTNLDNVSEGVNAKIAEKLELFDTYILSKKKNILTKLHVFCPLEHSEKVRNAMFQAGAGNIGDYSECSFNYKGEGSFKAGNQSNPFVGNIGKRHIEEEIKVEVVFEKYKTHNIINAMLKAHPYEEAAYDLYDLSNTHPNIGSGMIGQIKKTKTKDFILMLKSKFEAEGLRCTKLINDTIETVAICGGAGSFLLNQAIRQNADIFITADFKYHQFFDANDKIIIADIGHYESEQFTKELIISHLSEKFPNFALHLSEINTNPIKYY